MATAKKSPKAAKKTTKTKQATTATKAKVTRKSTAKAKSATKSSKAASTKANTTVKAITKPDTSLKNNVTISTKSEPAKAGVFDRLRRWNIGLGLLHAGQAVAVTALAYDSDATFPIRVSYLDFNQVTQQLETATRTVADVPLVWLIVTFLALSSVFHFIIAGPWFGNYVANLKKGLNPTRWIEYSLSASVMVVAIGMLSGVTSLELLISLFVVTAIMNLLGWVMEKVNSDKDRVDWLSYNIGCLAGALPWVVLAMYFAANAAYGTGNPPTFVYIIYFSIFAFFNSFAINMYLQYKKIGPWSDYLYGEKVYMILSLVAKSALAWQVFAGSLGPN